MSAIMLQKFKKKLWVSIFLSTLFTSVVYLGVWQMQRAIKKVNLLQSLQTKLKASPQELDTTTSPASLEQFTPLKFQATLNNEQYFLLDNQVHNKIVGYRIIAPAHTAKYSFLVDRGFIARQDIQLLPQLAAPPLSDLKGYVYTPVTGLVLKADQFNMQDPWPRIIQKVDITFMSRLLATELLPFVIRLDSSTPLTLTSTPIDFGISPTRHRAYAFQWFSLAGLMLIYCLVLLYTRCR